MKRKATFSPAVLLAEKRRNVSYCMHNTTYFLNWFCNFEFAFHVQHMFVSKHSNWFFRHDMLASSSSLGAKLCHHSLLSGDIERENINVQVRQTQQTFSTNLTCKVLYLNEVCNNFSRKNTHERETLSKKSPTKLPTKGRGWVEQG